MPLLDLITEQEQAATQDTQSLREWSEIHLENEFGTALETTMKMLCLRIPGATNKARLEYSMLSANSRTPDKANLIQRRFVDTFELPILELIKDHLPLAEEVKTIAHQIYELYRDFRNSLPGLSIYDFPAFVIAEDSNNNLSEMIIADNELHQLQEVLEALAITQGDLVPTIIKNGFIRALKFVREVAQNPELAVKYSEFSKDLFTAQLHRNLPSNLSLQLADELNAGHHSFVNFTRAIYNQIYAPLGTIRGRLDSSTIINQNGQTAQTEFTLGIRETWLAHLRDETNSISISAALHLQLTKIILYSNVADITQHWDKLINTLASTTIAAEIINLSTLLRHPDLPLILNAHAYTYAFAGSDLVSNAVSQVITLIHLLADDIKSHGESDILVSDIASMLDTEKLQEA